MSSWLTDSHVALVTGATGTIGYEIALGVAKTGATTILAVRDLKKGEEVAEKIRTTTSNKKISVEHVDYSSLKTVKELSERISTKHGGKLNLLIDAAGAVKRTRQLTDDGIETQLALNVFSVYSLITYFRPLLAAAAKTGGKGSARAVFLTSFYVGDVDMSDLEFSTRLYEHQKVYKQSKALVRVLTGVASRELKEDGINVTCCHPGIVTSPSLTLIGFSRGTQTAPAAATTPLLLALSREAASETGVFYRDGKKADDPYTTDVAKGKEIWSFCKTRLAAVIDASKGKGSKDIPTVEKETTAAPVGVKAD